MGHSHSSNEPEVHKSHKKEYMIIFFVLAILTVLEVWVAEIQSITKLTKGLALTLLAIGKAFIVAYYYMHLKEETKWVKFIAALPIMAAVFAIVLILEATFKPF